MKHSNSEMDQHTRNLFEQGAGAPGWDTPPDAVWDAIAERIQPPQRKRRIFWWVFGLSMAALLAFLATSLSDSTGSATEPEQTSKTVFLADIPEIDQNGKNVQNAPSESNQGTIDEPAEAELPFDSVPALETSAISSTQNSSTTSTLPSSSVTLKKATPNAQKDAVELKDVTTGDVTTGDVPSAEPKRDQTIPKAPFASGKPSTPGSTYRHVPKYAYASFLDSRRIKLSWERALPIQSPANAAIRFDNISTLNSHTARPWSVALAVSPSWGTRRIATPDRAPLVRRDILRAQEAPVLQAGLGLTVAYALNDRFSLNGGIEYSSFTLKNEVTQQVRYSRFGETVNDRGNFESRYDLQLNNSYGEVQTDVVVERSPGTSIIENRFINLTLDARQTMSLIKVPVSLRYHFPVGRVRAICYGGLSANLLVGNQLNIQSAQSPNDQIVRISVPKTLHLSGGNDLALGYQLGAAIELPLGARWSLQAGPSLSGYIQPLYHNSDVRVYPVMADIDIGVSYKL